MKLNFGLYLPTLEEQFVLLIHQDVSLLPKWLYFSTRYQTHIFHAIYNKSDSPSRSQQQQQQPQHQQQQQHHSTCLIGNTIYTVPSLEQMLLTLLVNALVYLFKEDFASTNIPKSLCFPSEVVQFGHGILLDLNAAVGQVEDHHLSFTTTQFFIPTTHNPMPIYNIPAHHDMVMSFARTAYQSILQQQFDKFSDQMMNFTKPTTSKGLNPTPPQSTKQQRTPQTIHTFLATQEKEFVQLI